MDWRTRWADELADLAPTWERKRSAVRILLALLTVTLIGQIAHLEQTFWSAISVAIICSLPERASIDKAILRLIATVLGVLLTVVCYASFDQAQPGLLLCALLIVGFGSYFWATSALYPYAFFLLSFTSALFTYVALVQPDQLETLAWTRCVEIVLGVFVGTLVNSIVLPVSSSDLLRRRLAERLGHIAGRVRTTTIAGGASAHAVDLPPLPRDLRLAGLWIDFSFARRETGSVRQHPAAWSTMISISEAMRVSAEQLARRAAPPSTGSPLDMFAPEWARLSSAVADELEAAAAALAHGSANHPSSLAATLAQVNESLRLKRQSAQSLQLTSQESTTASAAMDALRTLSRRIELFETSQAALQGPPERRPLQQFSDRIGLGRNWPAVEWARVVSAYKVALAMLICVIIGSLQDWGYGISMVATCAVLATTESIGGLVIKARLRLLGAAAGGLVGLVLILGVIPWLTTVGGLMVALAIAFAPFAYIAACGPSVSYIGLQGVIALAIATLAFNQPSIDLVPPSSRCLGIVIGAVIFWLVQLAVLPVRASVRLPQRIAAVLEQIARIAEVEPDGAAPTVGEQLAPLQSRLSTLLLQVSTDITELGAEEAAGARSFNRGPADQAVSQCRLCDLAITSLADARLRALRLAGDHSKEWAALESVHGFLHSAARALRALAGRWAGKAPDTFAEHLAGLRQQAAQLRLGIDGTRAQLQQGPWAPELVSALVGMSSLADAVVAEMAALEELAAPEVLVYGPDQRVAAGEAAPVTPAA